MATTWTDTETPAPPQGVDYLDDGERFQWGVALTWGLMLAVSVASWSVVLLATVRLWQAGGVLAVAAGVLGVVGLGLLGEAAL